MGCSGDYNAKPLHTHEDYGWYCLMNGIETLKPGLYHDIITYNISQAAVNVSYDPIKQWPIQSMRFRSWSNSYVGKFFTHRRKDWEKIWPKTNATDFLMDPQNPMEIEPWLGWTITTRKS